MTSVRTLLIVVLIGAAGLVALAYWQRETPTPISAPSAQPGQHVSVEGCLTAAGAGFALTPVDRNPLATAMANTTDVAPTYTYELVGDPERLREHAGRVVRIEGRLHPAVEDSVEYDRSVATPAAEPDVPPGQPAEEPKVETKAEAEIHVRRLQVESIEATTQSCLEQP